MSFEEPTVWNIYIWCPKLINNYYIYLLCRDHQKWLFLTSFFTKHLILLYLTLSNFIYSYPCKSLIFWHLVKSTNSNYCLTMKFYTHYDMIINYTLLFVLNIRYFEQIMRALEDNEGNQPGSRNSASVTWNYLNQT